LGIILAAHFSKNNTDDILFSAFMGIVVVFSIALIIASLTQNSSKETSLKDNTLKIEVRQKLLNGQIVSTDTVYVFTPKKKDK
jgi:hypothetical protein